MTSQPGYKIIAGHIWPISHEVKGSGQWNLVS